MKLPGQLSVIVVRRDKGAKSNHTRISKQLSNLSNPTDVLLPVFRSKSKVLVQTSPDIVAIKTICRNTSCDKVFFQGKGDCRLARSRETREPDRTATEATS